MSTPPKLLLGHGRKVHFNISQNWLLMLQSVVTMHKTVVKVNNVPMAAISDKSWGVQA